MTEPSPGPVLLDFIVDRVGLGIFAVDPEMRVALWNRFMAVHSGKAAESVIGHNLFEEFPDLPRGWLQKKIESVFVLKNFAFTSWEQRPYLFHFPHNRPITGGVECMQQNCTFMPIRSEAGQVELVCITLQDATDASVYQTMLKEALARLEASSRVDGLTQIFNRMHWQSRLAQEFARVRRQGHGSALSVILCDLDHFKNINDTWGHLAGDEVLRVVARLLTTCLRSYDVAGRYGGEEFGIILPDTPLEAAGVVAERVRAAVERAELQFEGTSIPFTLSLGIAEVTDETGDHEKLIAQADAALYRAKACGRNRSTAYVAAEAQEKAALALNTG